MEEWLDFWYQKTGEISMRLPPAETSDTLWVGKICDFRPVTNCISETVQYIGLVTTEGKRKQDDSE